MTLKLAGSDEPPDPPVRPERQDHARGPLARLLIALVLCILLALVCWVVLPHVGVYMPPAVPLLGFAAIAGGTIVAAWERGTPGRRPGDPDSGEP